METPKMLKTTPKKRGNEVSGEVALDWLKTADVAELTGVGTTAIKRWADEGRLACRRTPGGHRRFRKADVEQILAEERGKLDDSELKHWILLAQTAKAIEFESALLSARVREGSWHQVASILGDVVTELGLMFVRGEITSMQENGASERMRRALANVSERMIVTSQRTAVLVAASSYGPTLGLSIMEIVLREVGFETMWLGTRVPASEFDDLLSRTEIALIAASAYHIHEDEHLLKEFASDLAEVARPYETSVVLGGTANWPDVHDTHRFRSWKDFSEFARSLTGS